MLIISTFEQTLEIEQALKVLEEMGIHRDNILVVPLDADPGNPEKLAIRAQDVKARAFEGGMVFATAAGVIGASVGFALKWGPIAWGLISTITGFVVGFGTVNLFGKLRGEQQTTRLHRRPFPELAVIIQCGEDKSTELRHVLWKYRAISVGNAMETASK